MRLLQRCLPLTVLPAALLAQPTPAAPAPRLRLDLSRLSLGTDTLELVVAAAEGLRYELVESVTRGRGADAGTLRMVSAVRYDGDAVPSSIDTVFVDARTLRFRRATSTRRGTTGQLLSRTVETVRDGLLIMDEPGDSGRTVTRTRLSPDSLPLAVPNLVMRAASLEGA